MSRIGRLPIQIPSGVDVDIAGRNVTVKGPKGTLTHTLVEPISIEREDGVLGTRLVRCWLGRVHVDDLAMT